MSRREATVVTPDETRDRPPRAGSGGGSGGNGPGDHSGRRQRGGPGGGPPSRRPRPGRGGFTQYKPDQGIWTRRGTFIGSGLLIAWGAKFLYDQLSVYQGDEAWRLLITAGIPIAFAVGVGAFVWWVAFGGRKSSDFMIATEGEMKKVSWSSKREVVGSTKVVILFTVLLAVVLFVVDLVFQHVFSYIGVLKVV